MTLPEAMAKYKRVWLPRGDIPIDSLLVFYVEENENGDAELIYPNCENLVPHVDYDAYKIDIDDARFEKWEEYKPGKIK